MPILVALAYAAAGWLALQLRVPPDYAIVIYFPAGIAAGAALVAGRGALPGVLLGALAMQVMTHHAMGVDWRHLGILVPAVGATAMAALTAAAIRRWVGYPTALDEGRAVLRLLLLIVPALSAVNASFSVPALVARGVIARTDGLSQWLGWWTGDALGAVMMLPLVLVLFGQPRDAWRPRLWGVGAPLVVALTVSVGVMRIIADTQDAQLRLRLEQAGEQAALALQRRFDAQIDALEAIGQLVARDPGLTQAEFEHVTALWLRRYPGTQNFTFNWRVPAHARAHYECCHPGWPIMGRDAQGHLFPAPAALEHLVITRLAPLATNERARGLDILTHPPLRRAAEQAIASRQPYATEPFRLVQEVGTQRGIAVYHAVWHAQTQEFLGIVSSAFRMDDITTAALEAQPTHGLSLCLIDPDASGGPGRLVGPAGCEALAAHSVLAGARHDWPVRFAQRTWMLRLTPTDAFLRAAAPATRLHATAIAGFLAVALLGAFLLVTTGQRRRIESLVQERTAELARSHAHLTRLAHFDTLTGLVNRTHWTELARATLNTARREGKEVGIVFLDLDRFKHINDSLGHPQGDRLLQTVAQRLQACLRARDVLARFGGDEFVALLPWVKGREGAAAVARKIARALDEPIPLDGVQVRIGGSQGVVLFPDDGDTVDVLLRHADTAMYAAKAAGRNQWRFFEPAMQAHASRRLTIESALRAAVVDPEHHGLSLAYQPQLDPDGQRLLGLEALLRWHHPSLGSISPAEFIPVAEDAGIIDRLGAWVLARASTQWAQWLGGPAHNVLAGVTLAINVSPIEFNRPDFLDRVEHALARLRPVQGLLELEVTESLLLQATPDILQRMEMLTELGVRLSLDDFGSGYSSLGYLKRLPITKLKIDRAFVQGVPGDGDDAAIVRATLSMAHDLGLRVVAEGVETPAQRDFLRRHGCDAVQGWLYARAMPAAALIEWLQAHPMTNHAVAGSVG